MADKKYFVIDAGTMPLGRIATRVATVLRGKNSPTFMPNVLSGNIVVVINAGKVNLTARKELSKQYHHYSGYHGGLKTKVFSKLKEEKPEEIIKSAVRGMLPKNKLQKEFLKNLKIFRNSNHNLPVKDLTPIKE
jgi:large subunit ribosomal protein L13